MKSSSVSAASVITVLVLGASPSTARPASAQTARTVADPVFRSSVDLVSLSAVVRDQQGRLVPDLTREEFEVFDAGVPRHIVEFAAQQDGPVSVAFLVDTSGSMRLSDGLMAGRAMIEQVLARLRPGRDEVALYAFDSGLRRVADFSTDPDLVRAAMDELEAFGTTALYDAVGRVAMDLEGRSSSRRAMVLVTDGLDTSSAHSAADVSSIASASNVPVYVVNVSRTATAEVDVARSPTAPTTNLVNLAHWTGGALFAGRGANAADATARGLLAELRHQYLLAFESAGPGWRPVDVRLRRGQVTVRTRSAYQSSHPGS